MLGELIGIIGKLLLGIILALLGVQFIERNNTGSYTPLNYLRLYVIIGKSKDVQKIIILHRLYLIFFFIINIFSIFMVSTSEVDIRIVTLFYIYSICVFLYLEKQHYNQLIKFLAVDFLDYILVQADVLIKARTEKNKDEEDEDMVDKDIERGD